MTYIRWMSRLAPFLLICLLWLPTSQAQLLGSYRFLDMFYLKKVALIVHQNYVERSQIEPKTMFRDALQHIQALVPAILIQFDQAKQTIHVQVDQQRTSFPLPQLAVISDIPHQLWPIFEFVQKTYKGEVKLRDIEFSAIHGLLKSLDQHSNFLTPDYYRDMNTHTSGKFGGLGIVIQSKDGWLTIVSPMPDTPASKAGLRPLDQIVRIGEESTVNMELNDAVNRLRGDPGTPVEIWVMRKGFSQPRRFKLIRALIKVKSVSNYLFPDGIGYIRIKNFQQNTTDEVRTKLWKMTEGSNGKLRGLILDLRDNPGGLLEQSISLSDLFLDKGVIVTHAGGSQARKVRRATDTPPAPTYPIVVLVNSGSASASEIVAGALKNNRRALVLGQRTYGKGTVQILYPISQRYMDELSALKLTVAQYLTPGDISIQEIGITPDIDINAALIEKSSVQTYHAEDLRLRKAKNLPKYLKGVQEQRKALLFLDYIETATEKEKREKEDDRYSEEQKEPRDFEAKLARDILLQTESADPDELLKKATPLIHTIRLQEEAKIEASFKKIGIDWSAAPAPARNVDLAISYKIIPIKKDGKKNGKKNGTSQGNGSSKDSKRLHAGSSFKLQITVQNKSSFPAYRVRGITRSKHWFLNRREFAFGKILPRKSKKWEVEFSIPKFQRSQVHKFELDVEGAAKDSHKHDIWLSWEGKPRPRFAFSYALEEIKGNQDGLVQAGESFAIRVSVQNQGTGKAVSVNGNLKNKGGTELFIERGRLVLGELKPGASTTGRFLFRTQSEIIAKSIKMELQVFDAELLTSVRDVITIPIHPSPLAPLAIQGSFARVNEPSAWIYSGASLDSPRIARATKASVFRILHRLGPFYHVQLPSSLLPAATTSPVAKGTPKPKPEPSSLRVKPAPLTGWIAASDIVTLTQAPSPKPPRAVSFYWQYKTPQIEIPGVASPIFASSETYTLKGSIQNNVPLRDAYIFLGTEKIFYQSLRNLSRLDFQLPVKLKPGLNTISIVARETEDFAGYQEIHIFYDPKGTPLAGFGTSLPTP